MKEESVKTQEDSHLQARERDLEPIDPDVSFMAFLRNKPCPLLDSGLLILELVLEL